MHIDETQIRTLLILDGMQGQVSNISQFVHTIASLLPRLYLYVKHSKYIGETDRNGPNKDENTEI